MTVLNKLESLNVHVTNIGRDRDLNLIGHEDQASDFTPRRVHEEHHIVVDPRGSVREGHGLAILERKNILQNIGNRLMGWILGEY